MSAPPEKVFLLRDGFRCLLFADALCVPLRVFLFGFRPAELLAGLFPLTCLFLYLPFRCRTLRLGVHNFFEYFEEE